MNIDFKTYRQTLRPPSRDWGAQVESNARLASEAKPAVESQGQYENTPETLMTDALTIGRGLKPVGNFDLAAFKALRFKLAGEKHFEERLPERTRDMFKGLSEDQKEAIVRVGSAFGGHLDGTPLIKLMEDGRLFDKDSSGQTPLQRLADLTDPDRSGGPVSSNFLRRVLGAIENPGEAPDAKRRGLPSAEHSPAEYIRAAGEEYVGDVRAQGGTQWNQAPEAIV